ncbi:lipoprotein [Tatumella sp. JGM100]|nr:lipoprotein [Tatumella sp. JGM16]MBS0878539.1 lipoprotein [Tatumella sp. JGM82]MBS0892131.1 lipoprotein [Tatumella sp. JGM94]MBS0894015.1 lipoprotein [Tatumella sp. JGM130]MBS0903230.1 lipoprotein [Tatumella sp. JGM100]MBS0913925.1 lipoprotein [Tatumella sp. JGM91]
MKKMFGWLALIVIPAVLTGCGLKGPLYFPKTETTQQEQQQTAPVNTSETDAAAPAGTVAP